MFGKAGSLALTYGNQQEVRGMATLKAISLKLKSVNNIQKITQSMKMVSAAKYTKAERDLKQARPYGEGAKSFYVEAEVSAPSENPHKLLIALTEDFVVQFIPRYPGRIETKCVKIQKTLKLSALVINQELFCRGYLAKISWWSPMKSVANLQLS